MRPHASAGDFAAMTDDYADDDLFDVAPIIATDDDAVVRRVKAVAATRPLHDLDRNKGTYDGSYWEHYDLLTLAVAAIDQVALAMGVSAGLPYDDATGYVAGQAERQRPDGAPDEWLSVAQRVLGGLVSDAPHEAVYALHAGGTVSRRIHDFRLLYEQWSADGSVHLRASEEAINVLVDALDLDVESAQIAAEAQMRVLIARNALASAVAVARRARYQSVQYLERVRTVVRDTSINPDTCDWAEEIPAFLTASLDHVIERVEAEGQLVQAVEERRDAAASTELRRQANQLIAVLRECRLRHTDLQRHLLGARQKFRDAQDDRFARPRTSLRRADIEGDVLEPLLSLPVAEASAVGDRIMAVFAAPRRIVLPTLAVMIDELLEPRAEPAPGEPEPEPVFGEEPSPWWEPYWDVAEDIIDSAGDQVTLSTLIAQARGIAEASTDGEHELDGDTLAGAVCHVAHELIATPLGEGVGEVRLAVPTGARIVDPAVDADDLLVVVGDILDPSTSTPAPVPADPQPRRADPAGDELVASRAAS